MAKNITGSCLCGSIQYEVQGTLTDILMCHCANCRKHHGTVAAYTGCKKNNLNILSDENLVWYDSVKDVTKGVKRGFCNTCGSSLFWNPEEGDELWISTGSLNGETGLKIEAHIWLSEKGDYYEICDDFPQHIGDPDNPELTNS
jgi:hypothetical protein